MVINGLLPYILYILAFKSLLDAMNLKYIKERDVRVIGAKSDGRVY